MTRYVDPSQSYRDEENRKHMKLLRDQKTPPLKNQYYNEFRMMSGEEREIAFSLQFDINSLIGEVNKQEEEFNSNKKEKMIILGKKAYKLKKLLKTNLEGNKRASLNKAIKLTFGNNIRRINEAIIIYKTHKKLKKKFPDLSHSKLLTIGEALHSKNSQKKKLTTKLINANDSDQFINSTVKDIKKHINDELEKKRSKSIPLPEDELIAVLMQLRGSRKKLKQYQELFSGEVLPREQKDVCFKTLSQIEELCSQLNNKFCLEVRALITQGEPFGWTKKFKHKLRKKADPPKKNKKKRKVKNKEV